MTNQLPQTLGPRKLFYYQMNGNKKTSFEGPEDNEMFSIDGQSNIPTYFVPKHNVSTFLTKLYK
jgi:hypothetical protein